LKTGRWTMINRAELEKILSEQALQQQVCTDAACAVKVGKLLGVRKIVTGQVTKVTDTLWQLSASLTDVETGEIKRQEVVNHPGDFSSLFLSGMANVAQRLSATEQELASGVTRLTPQSIAPKLFEVLRDAPSVALVLSPDNTRLYYGTGAQVRGWQVLARAEAGKPVQIPKGDVSALAVNRQGTLLAAGGTGGTVTLIDVAAGKALFTANAHGKAVTSVAFSPTDELVASGSTDEKVQVTHLRSGEKVFVLDDLDDEVRAVRFSADGRFLFVATKKRSLRVFDVNTQKESRAFRESSSELLTMTTSQDGALLAVGAKQIDIDLRRNRRLDTEVVKIRNVKTGEELASFEAHGKAIRALAFFPDSRFLASGADDKQIKLWDLEARSAVASLSLQGAVTALGLSGNGRWLAGADESGRITIWEVVK
jgi:WD40 repeat protein